MCGFLGIKALEIGPDFIKAEMPVGERTTQPFGILHGGASVVLAESIGSIGSNLIVDPQKYRAVGMEINANHVRSVSEGKVYCIASPLHVGKTSHIWEIKIYNAADKLVCISRHTVALIPA